MTELKPCPFCGGRPVFWDSPDTLVCHGCGVRVSIQRYTRMNGQTVADIWNRRESE